MDEPARHDPASSPGDPTGPARHAPSAADPTAELAARHWSSALPAPPFVIAGPGETDRRLAPLSPRVAVLLVAAIAVGLVLWMGRDAVRPFIIGLLVVYLMDPPVRWLARHRVPRPLAILGVYAVVAVVIVEFLNLTLAPLVAEIQRFLVDLPQLAEQFEGQLQRLAEVYAGLNLPEGVRQWIDRAIATLGEGEAEFDPGILLPVVSSAGSFVGALFGYILLPVWAFYLLKDRIQLTAAFDRALPPAWRPDTWATIRIVERVFGQWIRAQILLGITVAVATFAGLMLLSRLNPIFGEYAVLLSVIAGVLELLPIIGPIIAAIPAVLLAATAGLEATIGVLVLYTVIQQLENNLLVPKIQGNATQLHPAAVMFALVLGASLAGLLGAILALPVTAAFRDVVRYLFRRMGPHDDPASMAELGAQLGIEPMADSEGPPAASGPLTEPATTNG
jgi:predicted PurR-regulated permease PerM